jgi:IrrE N-terminal-like domain
VKQISAATWKETVDDAFMFRRRPDGKIRHELCRRIANLKSKLRCDDFPTNVGAIASEIGIREIRRVPLASRGRLIRMPGGFGVEIDEQLDIKEQRFVVAHEITHVLLAGGMVPAPNGFRFGYNRIETLCDFGAREILLPLKALRHELRGNPNLSLARFAAIAEEADCSLHVVAQVVSELPGEWQTLVFLFCKSGSGILDIETVIPATPRHVELDDDEVGVVRKALREKRLVRGNQSVWFDGHQIEISAEALPLDENRVAILTRSMAFSR